MLKLKSTYSRIAQPELPSGWTEHKAPSGEFLYCGDELSQRPNISTGHTYYYNASTNTSTYTRPIAPPPASETAPVLTPQHLPGSVSPFNAPQGATGFPTPFQHRPSGRGDFQGGRAFQDRRHKQPEDRPKTKHTIPGCTPWLLVKTKLGRRFVYNPDTNESYWKFPADVMKGVIEYDRIEREKRERRERGEPSEDERSPSPKLQVQHAPEDDSDEYEEVEVTDDEGEEGSEIKRPRYEDEPPDAGPVEFNEDDIAYQLQAMEQGGEEYFEEDEAWEGEEAPLSEEDSKALFKDLLNDFLICPYSTWEKIIEEGRIMEDDRYTALPNMRSRKEVWDEWGKERIQFLKEKKAKEEAKDPKIGYIAFLESRATPKLYWPEFKRKFKKESPLKETRLGDKDKEKLYRDHINRLKLPEATRKSDLSALLKSIPLHQLNRSSTLDTLPSALITDLRYISLPAATRDPLIEAYITTLDSAPEASDISPEEQAALDKQRLDRQRREKALADRERKVQQDKRRQQGELRFSKEMLREGEAELERAMRAGRDGLRGHLEDEIKDEPMRDV